MNIRQTIILCSVLLPSLARADWTLVQNVVSSSAMGKQTNVMTMKIKGDNIRIDMGSNASVLKDVKTGDQTVLMHQQKQMLRQTSAQIEARAMAMKKAQGITDTATNKPPTLTGTGKTEKINGYDTTEFVWKGDQASGNYSVAKDFPHYATVLKALEDAFAQERKLSLHPMPDQSQLPGYPIRSVQVMSMAGRPGLGGASAMQTVTNTVTLVSSSEASLPASDFVAPTNYTAANMSPRMPQAPSRNSGSPGPYK